MHELTAYKIYIHFTPAIKHFDKILFQALFCHFSPFPYNNKKFFYQLSLIAGESALITDAIDKHFPAGLPHAVTLIGLTMEEQSSLVVEIPNRHSLLPFSRRSLFSLSPFFCPSSSLTLSVSL